MDACMSCMHAYMTCMHTCHACIHYIHAFMTYMHKWPIQKHMMWASLWAHVGVILDGHSGDMLESFWGQCGIVLESCRVMLASFWDHFGVTLGPLWHRFGVILGSLWGHFGVTLESFWDQKPMSSINAIVGAAAYGKLFASVSDFADDRFYKSTSTTNGPQYIQGPGKRLFSCSRLCAQLPMHAQFRTDV